MNYHIQSKCKQQPPKNFISLAKNGKKTHAVCFCILHNEIPIGTISISHCDYKNKNAKCGYWIESNSWGKGYTTKAFDLAVKKAREIGFERLSCTIIPQNVASIALWKRQGADITEVDGRICPLLDLLK